MLNRNVLVKILLLLIVLNVCLVSIIYYISCVKTDVGYRALAKFGFVEYNNIANRHFYEYRCLEGWANCLNKSHDKADVVFYGNSITYESDFQIFFPQLRVCNLGCNRDDLDDLIHRSFIISSVQPRKIFVLGGINRLMNVSLVQFENKYNVLVDSIKRQNPAAKLYLQSILPVNVEMELGSRYADCIDKIKQANIIIKNISRNKQCVYVDLYSVFHDHDSLPRKYSRDGLHLNTESYALWANIIKPYVEE